ncbi:hypothetical protein [Nannocystis pusilla]|uniref:hypothetical protein n=1 Tax=Nannocystis pusilla TaxID=889268 RepID=UPI003DA40101
MRPSASRTSRQWYSGPASAPACPMAALPIVTGMAANAARSRSTVSSSMFPRTCLKKRTTSPGRNRCLTWITVPCSRSSGAREMRSSTPCFASRRTRPPGGPLVTRTWRGFRASAALRPTASCWRARSASLPAAAKLELYRSSKSCSVSGAPSKRAQRSSLSISNAIRVAPRSTASATRCST